MPGLIDEKVREELKSEGAKAALSAYNCLVENKLVARKAVLDSWQQQRFGGITCSVNR
ncbi:MAG: hypothetical protein WBE28_10530 [bacterium]